jgi:hypothetical protein
LRHSCATAAIVAAFSGGIDNRDIGGKQADKHIGSLQLGWAYTDKVTRVVGVNWLDRS